MKVELLTGSGMRRRSSGIGVSTYLTGSGETAATTMTATGNGVTKMGTSDGAREVAKRASSVGPAMGSGDRWKRSTAERASTMVVHGGEGVDGGD